MEDNNISPKINKVNNKLKIQPEWWVILILVIVIIIFTYVSYERNSQQILIDEELKLNSTIFGIQGTIIQILQTATQCQEVPLTFNNITYNLIWTECLNLNNTGGK